MNIKNKFNSNQSNLTSKKLSSNNIKSRISEQNKIPIIYPKKTQNLNKNPKQTPLQIIPQKNSINQIPQKPKINYDLEYKNLQEENNKLKQEFMTERKKVLSFINEIHKLNTQIEQLKKEIQKEKRVKRNIEKNIINYDDFEDDNFPIYYEEIGMDDAINAVEQQIIDELCPNPDKMSYEQLLELEDKVGNVNKGLNKDKINKIPVVTFKKGIYEDCDKCIICQEKFDYGEKVKLLNCGHVFHQECIEPWLAKEKSCPFCKSEVRV